MRRIPLGSYTTPSNYATGGDAGLDGNKPQLAQYNAAFERASREIDIFNLLILPRVLRDGSGSNQTDAERALLWGPASAFCRNERAFLLIDPPAVAWGDANAARNDIANLRIGVVGDHAMVTLAAPQHPRSCDRAAQDRGPERVARWSRWRASTARAACGRRRPASKPRSCGVRGVEHRDLRRRERPDQSARRSTPSGSSRTAIVIWGARTLAGFDNSGQDDYKYVPVRRLALFLEESLYRGLQFAVFQPNDEPLWAQIRLAAGAFMNNLFRRGAFQGQKASDAYFVKCDAETTTQNDINLGIVNVIVGFAPLKPAEFVIITIRQLAGQVQT